MPNTPPKLFQATQDIPSIAARRGDFIMVYTTHLTVVRDWAVEQLAEQDRALLTPVRVDLRRRA